MSERTKFIARLRSGERMSDLCREFGISRKTGHKLAKRFATQGPRGLHDQSRRPWRSPQKTSQAVAQYVIDLRRKHPTWGPKKLKARLETLDPDVRWPAASTIGVILKDAGLVDGRRRKRRAWPSPAAERQPSTGPNDLWCIDFKGQFRLGNGNLCYPLTVTDHHSRFLLGCEALENTKSDPACAALEAVFGEYGLPERIRSDNGSPFASVGLGGLSSMSAWLMRLGIKLERIEPGKPQQNGRHERMHLTLKQEVTRPTSANFLQQQERLDEFRVRFNTERPHEALQMKTPGSLYAPSKRRLPRSLPVPSYPLHDQLNFVNQSGRVQFPRGSVYLSKALRGQPVGLRQLEDTTWLVSFMELDLAYLDLSSWRAIAIPTHDDHRV